MLSLANFAHALAMIGTLVVTASGVVTMGAEVSGTQVIKDKLLFQIRQSICGAFAFFCFSVMGITTHRYWSALVLTVILVSMMWFIMRDNPPTKQPHLMVNPSMRIVFSFISMLGMHTVWTFYSRDGLAALIMMVLFGIATWIVLNPIDQRDDAHRKKCSRGELYRLGIKLFIVGSLFLFFSEALHWFPDPTVQVPAGSIHAYLPELTKF